jgi:uncharacterized HAD superfamily protein
MKWKLIIVLQKIKGEGTMGDRKLRLGFDVDGVLYPWHEIIYNYMKYEHKMKKSYSEFWKEVTTSKITDWNNGMEKFWLENNLFLVQRDIRPDILDTLNYLTEVFDIYYVTSRIKTNWSATKYWFKRNKLPQIDNLYMVEGEKLPTILSNEIDFFVEDRIKHVLELKNHTEVILVRQPWNEEIWDEIPTIDSVTQVPELLGV